MSGSQLRLFPDSRPLVTKLGLEFFRALPTHPAVYFFRDGAGTVLYVGKARNLRRRLNQYRVANPERMSRRSLALLRRTAEIDWIECGSETAALARERELLLHLRPPFNRAGTWRPPSQYLSWRHVPDGLEIQLAEVPPLGWQHHGPLSSGARPLYQAWVRLLWFGIDRRRNIASMPAGWFHGRLPNPTFLQACIDGEQWDEWTAQLQSALKGDPSALQECLLRGREIGPFELKWMAHDLEVLETFSRSSIGREGGGSMDGT